MTKHHPETKKGTFFKGRIKELLGIKFFRKKPTAGQDKEERPEIRIKSRNRCFDWMMKNYETCKKAGLPVADLVTVKYPKGIGESKRGLKRADFEVLHPLLKEDFREKRNELAGIYDDALKKGIMLDPSLHNFGKDSSGKVKIMDFYPLHDINRIYVKKIINLLETLIDVDSQRGELEESRVYLKFLNSLRRYE